MKLPFALLALALLLAPPLAAQACPDPGHTFHKNDDLPDVPLGSEPIAVIAGLCVGEAAGTIVTLPPGSPTQRITQVSVGVGSGGSFSNMELEVEIYAGPVNLSAGSATLGAKLFDLGDLTQVVNVSGITGVYVLDMTSFDVQVSDDFVVAWRVVSNPNGTCGGGYSANIFTDNGPCTAGTNLIDEQTNGWIDPASFEFLPGFTLCTLSAYTGDWVIRACTEDAVAVVASATVRNGSGANPNVFTSLTLPQIGSNWITAIDINSTGADASLLQFAAGGPVQVPLGIGELLCAPPFLKPRSVASGAHSIGIPNSPGLIGLTLCVQGAGFELPGTLELYNALDIVIGP